MGLDGGTKITRSDVLRGQSWRMSQADGSRSTRGGCVTNTYQERQLDPQTRRLILWSCCALSGLPLAVPIVADLLGQLMNRQAVLEHLLAAKGALVNGDKAAQLRYSNQQRAAAGAFDHLKSMKDVFTVNLTPNPDRVLQQQQQQQTAAAAGGSSRALQDSSSSSVPDGGEVPLWVCPVTLLPCGSKQPFSALKQCGHVLSDKALAAISAADSTCPVCGKSFSKKDVVQINGSPEHMEGVRQQLKAKVAAKAAAKEAKAAEEAGRQRKRSHEALECSSSGAVGLIEGVTSEQPPKQQEQQRRSVSQGLLISSQQGNAAAAALGQLHKQQQQQQQQPPAVALGLESRPPKAARVSS